MRNQKTFFFFSILIVTPLLFFGNCFDGYERIKGSGTVSTREHSLSGITSVQLATMGKMVIEFGSEEKLVVEAEDNLHSYLEIITDGDTLKVRTKRGYNIRPRKEIKYRLTLQKLDTIATSSSGDISAPGFKADKIRLLVSSSGDIRVKDLQAGKVYLKVSSSGKIYTGNLKTEYLEVSISSSGDIITGEISGQEMETHISSSGNFRTTGGKVNSHLIRISSSGSCRAEDLECKTADVKISSSGDARVGVTESLKVSISSSGDVYYRGNPAISKHYSSSGRIKKID